MAAGDNEVLEECGKEWVIGKEEEKEKKKKKEERKKILLFTKHEKNFSQLSRSFLCAFFPGKAVLFFCCVAGVLFSSFSFFFLLFLPFGSAPVAK